MRMHAIVALVMLAAAAGAGCVSSPSPTRSPTPGANVGATVVDATAGLDQANALARAWHADAALRSLAGSEGVAVPNDDPPFVYDTRADPNVGDGLALEWTYF